MFTRNIFSQLCINRESGDISTEKSTAESIEMEKQKKRDINANINGKKELMKRNNVEIGKEEVLAIRNRFPTKIPIIVQRFYKENNLPHLDKTKFLVPQELTMSQFLTIIRNRMRVKSSQSLYLLVNNRSLISLSLTFAEVYNEHAGPDGFLYVTYASQETFGCSTDHKSTSKSDL